MENLNNNNNNNKKASKASGSNKAGNFLKVLAENLSAVNGGSLPVAYNKKQLEELVSDDSLLENGNEQLDLVAVFPVYLN